MRNYSSIITEATKRASAAVQSGAYAKFEDLVEAAAKQGRTNLEAVRYCIGQYPVAYEKYKERCQTEKILFHYEKQPK